MPFFPRNFFKSTHADAKLSYDNSACATTPYRLQFLDKPRDASASVVRSCNCEFADIWRYILETVQASTKITTECEYVVTCDLSNGVICNDLKWLLTQCFKVTANKFPKHCKPIKHLKQLEHGLAVKKIFSGNLLGPWVRGPQWSAGAVVRLLSPIWPVDDIDGTGVDVGHLLLPAQLPGTHWTMICVIRVRRLSLTVSDVCLKLGCFQSTSTYSALEVSHFMRYIGLKFSTSLLTSCRMVLVSFAMTLSDPNPGFKVTSWCFQRPDKVTMGR